MGYNVLFALLALLALISFAFAAPSNYSSVCSPWNNCADCTSTSICKVGQDCIQCGWCPSDGNCYIRPFDCTSWIPWNQTQLCVATPLGTPEEKAILWKIERIVLMVLGGLLAFFILVYIFTCIALRGRPRDFDSIMIDDFLHKNEEGYTTARKKA